MSTVRLLHSGVSCRVLLRTFEAELGQELVRDKLEEELTDLEPVTLFRRLSDSPPSTLIFWQRSRCGLHGAPHSKSSSSTAFVCCRELRCTCASSTWSSLASSSWTLVFSHSSLSPELRVSTRTYCPQGRGFIS